MSRRSPELRRFLRAFFAMGLAVLMIAMTAFTAGAVSTVYDFDIDGSEHPVSTPEPVATPDLSDHDIEETQNTEQIEAEEETSETDTLLADMDEAVVAFAEAGSTALQLKWEVQTDQNDPVGGATVQIQGPKNGGVWGSVTTVSDCVEEGCVDSLDEDPRPGFFSITQRDTGSGGYLDFNLGEIYQINGGDTPVGYTWRNGTPIELTPATWAEGTKGTTKLEVTSLTPGAWAEGQAEYEFDAPLALNAAPAITWEVKNETSNVGGSVFKIQGRLKLVI